MPQVCPCLHGGTCIDEDFEVCECPSGFEGRRCEDTYINFSRDRDSHDDNRDLIIIVSAILFAVFILIIVFIFTWRKIRSLKRRRAELKMRQTRKQSKATIEGLCRHGYSSIWEGDSGSEKSVTIVRNLQIDFESNPFPVRDEAGKTGARETV